MYPLPLNNEVMHIIQGEEGSVDLEDIDESGLSSADPLLGVQAKKPKDFQVFINLVDFCK